MKTLTELSGTLVRAAAAAMQGARQAAAPAPSPAPPPAAGEPSGVEPGATGTEASGAGTPPADPAAVEAATTPPALTQDLLEAVGKATGLEGDRLAMLCAAVEAAGERATDVRLVRVFGPEEPVTGAKAIRGHQYLVDLFPASMRQVAGSAREEGRRRGGPGRGGGRGGASRGGGEKGMGQGGFSMDSLREDRRKERGPGRPGGRRPSGGGGRTPGGTPPGR